MPLTAEAGLDQEALHHSVGAVMLDRAAVRVSGPEAVGYLQGQLSQDVASLAIGASAWAFLLQPQGKVNTWLRVTREGDESLVLDTDAVAVEAMVARLDRFKLRTRFDLEPLTWRCLALRGAGLPSLDLAELGGASVVARAPWPSVDAADVLGPEVDVPAGARHCSVDAYEALRIEQGVPKMGAELTDATIPGEAGRWVVDVSVSFTKGCYTGQELVARIDSRGGNVPRPIHGLVLDGDTVPDAGTELTAPGDRGGKVVGHVTSAAWSVRVGGPVALAVVARSVGVGDDVELAMTPSPITARVSDLPIA